MSAFPFQTSVGAQHPGHGSLDRARWAWRFSSPAHQDYSPLRRLVNADTPAGFCPDASGDADRPLLDTCSARTQNGLRARPPVEATPAMPDPSSLAHELQALIGEQVVVDVKHAYLYIGTLTKIGKDALVLKDADVHFCQDSYTTAELYLLETKKNGIRPNRHVVYVMLAEVLSISRLSDVVEY
jgi:hypothetical protein